jgi:hypothetical protein
MRLETLFKISGHSQIALALHRNTLDEIDVMHEQPSFAKASEGILLRAINAAILRSALREAGWMESARLQIEEILPRIQVPAKS